MQTFPLTVSCPRHSVHLEGPPGQSLSVLHGVVHVPLEPSGRRQMFEAHCSSSVHASPRFLRADDAALATCAALPEAAGSPLAPSVLGREQAPVAPASITVTRTAGSV